MVDVYCFSCASPGCLVLSIICSFSISKDHPLNILIQIIFSLIGGDLKIKWKNLPWAAGVLFSTWENHHRFLNGSCNVMRVSLQRWKPWPWKVSAPTPSLHAAAARAVCTVGPHFSCGCGGSSLPVDMYSVYCYNTLQYDMSTVVLLHVTCLLYQIFTLKYINYMQICTILNFLEELYGLYTLWMWIKIHNVFVTSFVYCW